MTKITAIANKVSMESARNSQGTKYSAGASQVSAWAFHIAK